MKKFRPFFARTINAIPHASRPMSSPFDPNGSYTGTSEFDDIPTQDADDL
ncbi:MAG: hypothetical protein ACI4M5_06335 [Christensenellales bacterium]